MRWSLPKLGVPKTVVILLYMFLSQMFPSERVITVHLYITDSRAFTYVAFPD